MNLIQSKFSWLIFLIGTVLYVNTSLFQYALDDKLVITANQITKKGFDGVLMHFEHDAMDGFWAEQYNLPIEKYKGSSFVSGGRYRPITLATHALEYGLFGENPMISHLINALLYGVLGVLIYYFVRHIYPEEESWFSVAFIVSLIYAVHPLHVEVVANIKGRDEILSFIFAIAAVNIGLWGHKNKNFLGAVLASLFFGISLLSKETTAPFLILFPLVMFFVGADIKSILKSTVPFAIVMGLYLFIRQSVLGETNLEPPSELMNNPFLLASEGQKWGVILVSFFAYLKLFVIPNPLTHDYYPFHLPFTPASMQYPEFTHWASLLGLILGVGLLAFALFGLIKKKKESFGIWLFFGTLALVSNALFPVGVFMNERFMFIPSLGLLLFVIPLLKKWIPEKTFLSIALITSFAFAGLSFSRSFAWENDQTLALADVETSIGSAKAHMAAGDALITMSKSANNDAEKNRLLNEAFGHLSTSLEIYPQYFPPLDLLANVYFETGNYKSSAEFYAKCYERKQNKPSFLSNIVVVGNKLVELKRYKEALEVYDIALRVNPIHVPALSKAAEIEARYLNNLPEALNYLNRAIEVEPGNADVLQRAGIVYAMSGDFSRGVKLLEESLSIEPNNEITINNLTLVYTQLGATDKLEALQR